MSLYLKKAVRRKKKNTLKSSKSESDSHSVVFDFLRPHGLQVALEAPSSMGFSWKEYWSGLPFPSPGDLPKPGIESRSPALQADSLQSKISLQKKKTTEYCLVMFYSPTQGPVWFTDDGFFRQALSTGKTTLKQQVNSPENKSELINTKCFLASVNKPGPKSWQPSSR